MRIFVTSVAALGFGWAATLAACHGPTAVVGRDSRGAAGEGELTEGSGGTGDGSGATGGASPSGSGGVAEQGGTGGATTGGNGGTGAAAESGGTGAVVGVPHVTTTTIAYVNQIRGSSDEPAAILKCLPSSLGLKLGSPQFRVYRVALNGGACDEPAHVLADDVERNELFDWLRAEGICDGGGTPCAELRVCNAPAATGADEDACLNEVEGGVGTTGWCYLSPEQGLGDAGILADCGPTHGSALRFMGEFSEDDLFVMFAALAIETETTTPELRRTVGATCIPEVERRTDFSGFSMNQAIVETANPACDSSICLVNHFQGRVSCPFGQSQSDVEASMPECFAPGSGAPVTVPVDSMRLERAARFTTTCSCRCDGPGEGPFCACPEGTECAPIVGESGSEALNALAGSYCIPSGHALEPNDVIKPETCRTERAAGRTNSPPLDYSVCEDPLPY